MKIKLFILGFLLFICGFGTLGWYLNKQHKQLKQITSLKAEYGSENNDYLKQYNDWLNLPDQERMNSPLELDQNGRPRTQEQIQQVQGQRLLADMDDLATDEFSNDPFYNVLYGENWQQKVSEYQNDKELSEIILTLSSVCGSLGSFIILWFVLQAVGTSIAKAANCFKHIFTSISRSRKAGDYDEKDISSPDDTEQSNINKDEEGKEAQLEDIVVIGDSDNKDTAVSEVDQTQETGDYKIIEKKRLPCKAKRNIQNKQKEELDSKTVVSNEKNKPIDHTLLELTEQVSAIREYAATQQNRLERLQDGYDWNIIKTFCLRIIRCIDNLEIRIGSNQERKHNSKDLEEVRDELIFALESSGVERFEPEINSDFRGQEKFAEAAKTRQRSNKPELKGKIEKVIRPGYKCFIDEENVRVVRPALVRVYG